MLLEQCSGFSVDIIIPVCNECDSIQQLTERLESLHQLLAARYKVRYLFIDDGSTDQTGELLKAAAPKGACFEILTHPINRGVGAAFRTAFQHVQGDYVCTIDADCSYGPDNLLQMIVMLENEGVDVVVASPYHPEGKVVGVQPWRIALSSNCSNLYRMITPLKLYTYTSIFRAYRGQAVKGLEIQSDGFVAAVEILLRVNRLGYRIKEMPMTLCRRSAGTSKMRIGKTVFAHVGLLKRCMLGPDRDLRVAVLKQPLRNASEVRAVTTIPIDN